MDHVTLAILVRLVAWCRSGAMTLAVLKCFLSSPNCIDSNQKELPYTAAICEGIGIIGAANILALFRRQGISLTINGKVQS